MRELKFRAWLIEREEMVEVERIDFLDYDDEPDLIICYNRDAQTYSAYPTDYKLMQFTGFRDKFNKEIYEEDFVKDNEGRIYIVKWIDDIASFKLVSIEVDYMINLIYPDGLEVIGNVYENPELRGGK
jgi:uncharacterized phage protein (TIGR01671 family)